MRVWRPAALREASTRLMAGTTTEEMLPGDSVASARPWVMQNGVFEPGVDVRLELGENKEVGVGDDDGELDACVGKGLEDLDVGVVYSYAKKNVLGEIRWSSLLEEIGFAFQH
ncbi:glycine cleavage system transcriptionalactivator, partial [Striga asiatica]